MGSGSLGAWRREFFSAFGSRGVEAPLELAQHLVQGAVVFARRPGFEPYEGFAAAAVYLGEPAGPVPVEFGRGGVPFSVAGPYDDARSVVRTLDAAVGEADYHLRGDAVLAPLVLNALAHRELLSPEDMTDAEHLLLLAENLLQLVELAGGGDGAEEALQAQGPEARDAVAAALDSAHPDRAGLEELRQLATRALRTPAARLGRARKRRRSADKCGRTRHR